MALGEIYHTIRFSNSWQPWGNVSATVANNPGQLFPLACAGIGNDLHLIGTVLNGNLYHTIRFSNSWQPWSNVSATVANNPVPPGDYLGWVSCAGIGNDLHVIGVVLPGIT